MNMNQLHLPQLTATYPSQLPPKGIMLVLGGRAPGDRWLQQAAPDREIWCVDSGIDACFRGQIIPDRLIGDGDSASAAGWRWGELLGVPIDRYPPEKSLTDTQLALQLLAAQAESTAIVTGAFGGRFDHAFSTIYSCLGQPFVRCLADEREAMFFLRPGTTELQFTFTAKPTAISLLPLAAVCRGVSISGVHWPLDGAELAQSLPYAVSNRLTEGGQLTATCRTGSLAVYFSWA